jgi:hypothetical protein
MTIETLREETFSRYKLALQREDGRLRILVLSTSAGKHRAVHTDYRLLNDEGLCVATPAIDENVADYIFKHFEQRGDTESFNVFRSALAEGELPLSHNRQIAPDDVRHNLGIQEKSFTATGTKLAYHWPIFAKYRDTGFGSIIRATLTNHQVCSSHCQYCSTISRNKKDSVSLEEAQAFVMKLYDDQAQFNRERFPEYNAEYRKLTGSDIRLRGLILSGGGQPNLWPHFTEFVDWLATLDIDLGLITNGFPQKVPEAIYKHFTWIRVSITPPDASPFYPDRRFDRQYLPETILHNPDITLGYSYVYGPWTTDAVLRQIAESMDDKGFDYCRLLTDCNLPRDSQLRAHYELAERLFKLGYIDAEGKPLHGFFHQLKYHGTPGEAATLWDEGQCFLQTYNVFWDTTGHEDNGHSFCYPCDSVTVLADEAEPGIVQSSERRFNAQKWGTVPNTDVERLYREPVKPYFDPRSICQSCLFMRNNASVKQLVQHPAPPADPTQPIQHVNFP